ncbi:MAG: DUF3109 family protein [Candidatus Omnitrophota bacterium]
MILIDNVIVSDEVIKEYFCCRLKDCHGLCCVSGKSGADLTTPEGGVYEENYQEIINFLSRQGVEMIEDRGVYERSGSSFFTTPLLDTGDCAYVVTEDGTVFCGLERAGKRNGSQLHKPISCQLYPVRVVERPPYEILHFDHRDVCRNARVYGREKNIRLYQFVREGLVGRFGRFGDEFYRRLSELAEDRNKRDT